MSWPTYVPKVKDGITNFNASDMNEIISSLEQRTDLLKQSIINDNIVNGVGFSDIGLDGCLKGQFVAYNKKLQKYIPANALWNDSAAIPSDEACVIGLLVSDVISADTQNTKGQGTILVSGIIRNKELITAIMGSEKHIPGNYYLKSDGRITCNIDEITFPIHCGTLTPSGCFVLGIQIPDFRTHTHTKYDLNTNYWHTLESIPSIVTPPEGALKYYDSEADSSIKNILRTYVSGLSLIANNQILVEYLDYEIREGYIWLKKDFGASLNVSLYATNPFMGLVPWLTSMTTAEDNATIKITQSGSTAIIDTDFPVLYEDCNTGKAIVRITNKGIETGNVVNNIKAGAGIRVTEESAGYVKIDSTLTTVPKYIELNILNGNGIIYGGDSNCIFKFPAGRASSIIGTVRTPGGYGDLNAKVFMYVDELGGDAASAYCTISTMTPGVNGIILGSHEVNFGYPEGIGTVRTRTTSTFSVTDNTLINITVGFNSPSSTVNVRAIGVMFEIPEV